MDYHGRRTSTSSRSDLEFDLRPDPGYSHPGYIDVILPASSRPTPVNDSILATPDLSAGRSPQRRRRRRPLVTTPSYAIELYDDERLIPIITSLTEQTCELPPTTKKRRRDANVQHRALADDSNCGSGSRQKAHWDAFRQYVERYIPVKIQDVALFREERCTTTVLSTNILAGNNEMRGRPSPVVALSEAIHSLPPQILDTVVTVQCAFHPTPFSSSSSLSPSTSAIKGTSISSAPEIDMALSSSCTNNTVPTFMGQEDQVTTEMTLKEAIEWGNHVSSSMAVCVAQLPIATSAKRLSRNNDANGGDELCNDYDDDQGSIRLKLDGTIEECTSECISGTDNTPMSHLSSMLRLPSYLLLGDIPVNDEKDGTNNTSNIVIHSINLWHASQTCCTNVHYDEHDNVLIVIEGIKTVELCPPSCIRGSGIYSEHANHPAVLRNVNNREEGEKERIHSEIKATRILKQKRTHIISVNTGEALYIPQGWWHRVESTPSSSNEGCTAINVWFEYRHSSRTNNIPLYMMPFQLRCVARRYYEVNADHAANAILERKRRQAIALQLTSDDVLKGERSKHLDVVVSLLRGNAMPPCCNIFSESWTRLMNDYDAASEFTPEGTKSTIITRFRNQLEYFLLQLNLNDAGHVRVLVQLWISLPLPTNPILRVKSNNLFTKLILELSPESCYIITQAWERHSSNAKDYDIQAEESYKNFFELAGSSEFASKLRRHLAMGVEDFRSEICQTGVLNGVLFGRV